METTKQAFGYAREALTVLEFYSTLYASSDQFQEQRKQVVAGLRSHATNQAPGTMGEALLLNLASALEK